MKIRHLIGAGVGALLLASAAFAGTNSKANAATPASCKALEEQFDKQAENSHAADISKARLLRTEGAELCTLGKATAGVKKLNEAVKMLGESPSHN